MYELIVKFTTEHLYLHILIIMLSASAMLVAMGIDLFFGIRKAKERGVARTSTGYKKTCEKGRKYFSPYFVLICLDIITSYYAPIPFFSTAWASYCVFCEFKSVREKAWEKEELRKAEKTVSVILENKDDIVHLLAKLLFEQVECMKAKENEKV